MRRSFTTDMYSIRGHGTRRDSISQKIRQDNKARFRRTNPKITHYLKKKLQMNLRCYNGSSTTPLQKQNEDYPTRAIECLRAIMMKQWQRRRKCVKFTAYVQQFRYSLSTRHLTQTLARKTPSQLLNGEKKAHRRFEKTFNQAIGIGTLRSTSSDGQHLTISFLPPTFARHRLMVNISLTAQDQLVYNSF